MRTLRLRLSPSFVFAGFKAMMRSLPPFVPEKQCRPKSLRSHRKERMLNQVVTQRFHPRPASQDGARMHCAQALALRIAHMSIGRLMHCAHAQWTLRALCAWALDSTRVMRRACASH